jgi:acyl carrier protein
MSNALEDIVTLIAPHNRKGVAVTPSTTFATDLEWDSLTVMDFVAEMEDHFDIIIPLNLLPDLETVGQVADAVNELIEKK